MPNARIALIEDNEEMRDNIKEILELADYTVYEAGNGKDGVRIIEEHVPDLIICDIMMPELDGYGVLKIISEKESTKHIPFIFLTAKSEASDFRLGMNLGADDYIMKPFTDLEMLEAIEIRLKRTAHLVQKYGRDPKGFDTFLTGSKLGDDIRSLFLKSEISTFQKGEKLYKEGQYPRELFFIHRGKLKAAKLNDEGKEFILAFHGKGDYIGYHALIEDLAHNETVEALTDVEVYTLAKKDFLNLINSDKDTLEDFMILLAKDLHATEERLLHLAYHSVRRRIAQSLVTICTKYNCDYVDLKREDIAAYAGTAKETVIRALGDFKSEHLIAVDKGDIKILDMDGLANIIG